MGTGDAILVLCFPVCLFELEGAINITEPSMRSMDTQESNVKTVRDLSERVFNQQNADRIGEFFAKNGKWHGGVLGTVEGTENMAGLFRSVFTAIPDLHV